MKNTETLDCCVGLQIAHQKAKSSGFHYAKQPIPKSNLVRYNANSGDENPYEKFGGFIFSLRIACVYTSLLVLFRYRKGGITL